MNIKRLLQFLGIMLVLFSCSNNLNTPVSNTGAKSIIILDADNNKQMISTLEYSPDGKKLLSANFYDDEEEFERKVNYEYDEDIVINKSVIKATGEVLSTSFDCSRAANGNIIRLLSDSTSMNLEYTYDDAGRIKSITATSTQDGITTVEEKRYE